jgi:uncharacterized protein (DUF1697 family)
MTSYIAMLRGINVAGQKKIRMEDLKALFLEMNLASVRTYIQSGNVLFESEAADPVYLAGQIEEKLLAKYTFRVPVVIRTPGELRSAIASLPFLPIDTIDTGRLHVTFLATQPADELVRKLSELDFGHDRFKVVGRDVYLYIPAGYGETKLTNAFFEKKLGTTATTRNWNTVNKLVELAN